MFAFLFSTLALRSLLKAHCTTRRSSKIVPGGYRLALSLLTFAGVVFRSELAILVATFTIYLFITQRISITRAIIPAGLGGLLIGLLWTVSIDSFFWQSTPLWPEWTGFYYNTIQGHSVDWGVSPWHFYFANAIPRLLLNPATYLLCIPVAVLNRATRRHSLDLLIPLLSFVGLYSFLPHKEWRFIIYIIPGLTATAAAGASWIWNRRTKSIIYALLSLGLAASVLLSFAASAALLTISSMNYPGGEALHFLHHNIDHRKGGHFRVFFDNLACQTGVTRFLENHDGPQTVLDVLETDNLHNQRSWTYSKTENLELLLDPAFWSQFDYVLAEQPAAAIGTWKALYAVYGYDGVRVLKPGEKSGDNDIENVAVAGLEEMTDKYLSSRVARIWRRLENAFRKGFLGGWWVELRMRPKITILKSTNIIVD
ncbi:Alg9-like mannosyltransferase family-domain-containing protein [Massariosphaeria phaeospora]|uniref:Mannosyltransferase n=1 Tax=Massariosphaeria phaeospora TaxID=100035 RepID=A0A7C8I2R2_9PLEO|nr:Alg9-like mannosyltransferase family-domain-containing protein [Massariosphaeria phaeospora]